MTSCYHEGWYKVAERRPIFNGEGDIRTVAGCRLHVERTAATGDGPSRYFLCAAAILLLTLAHEAVVRKLSSILSIIRWKRIIGMARVRAFKGTHGRAETSNMPRTPRGLLDFFSK